MTQRDRDAALAVVLPFGKYKGLLLIDVPTDYLRWLLEGEMSPSGAGQNCRHEFSVDTVCEHCDIMLSDYVRRLNVRVSDLEKLLDFWKQHHAKQKARADSYRQATIEALEDCFAAPEPIMAVAQFLRALQRTMKP